MSEPRRTWTGGSYDDREGITVASGPAGVEISAWYDGGVDLEVVARLTWEELDAMRNQSGPVPAPNQEGEQG